MVKENKTILINLLILVGIAVSCITTFVGGFYFRDLLAQETYPRKFPSVTPQPTKPASLANSYFDDSLFLVSKTEPHEVVIVSSSRNSAENTVHQTTRMSYFNGTQWERKVGN